MYLRYFRITAISVACLLTPILGHSAAQVADNQSAEGTGRGSIKGMLNSPYAKLAKGIVYIKEIPDSMIKPSETKSIKDQNIPESTIKPPEKNPTMDQKNKMFAPHVLPIVVGSTVDFPNTDDVRHSVYTRKGSANEFNLGQYDTGIVKHVEISKVGITHLACNVHTEMSGYILSLQNPFFAVTDKKERTFLIPNVPAGVWEITFFHEKIESVSMKVTVEPNKETYVEFTKLKRKR